MHINKMNKYLSGFFLLLFLSVITESIGQVVINEIVPSNTSVLLNSKGEYDDWIELYNQSGGTVNLKDYGLSDDSLDLYKFRFSSYSLPNNGFVLVYPNDDNNNRPAHHWETPVKSDSVTIWRYFAGTVQPDPDWRSLTYDDSAWLTSLSGFGYGDGDDRTTISLSSRSVMLRKEFTISDTSKIIKAILNIDYDDGFVAYLNGVEIARANLGVVGDFPLYNDLAFSGHEATLNALGKIDSFYIGYTSIRSIIRPGLNVLAVEVHNESNTSNDLSAIPFLSFGIKDATTLFANATPPVWFNNPGAEFFSANFKLSKSGETLFLTNPSGVIIDSKSYGVMHPDNSLGRIPNGSNNWCFIGSPTPAASNNASTCYPGYAGNPLFSLAPGYYTSSQSLSLSTTTPGGVIYYTTNGDVPSLSSQVYTSPINLSATQTIRAKVFASTPSPGLLPSETITNSYFINEDVSLPVFSITTDSLNLWDYNTGIYVLGPNASPTSPYQGANFWQKWEKPANVEYYDKTKNKVFSFDADIKIYGNYSRAKPQKSFEIKIDSKFGTGNFRYPLFSDKPNIDNIDNFVLRNSGTDWNVSHFRDAFMERVLKQTNTGFLAAEPVVTFLNGEFWGVYTTYENHDHHWMKNNYNLDRDEIDYLKESGSAIWTQEGSDVSFWMLYNYATVQNPTTQQYYDFVDSVLDIKNHVDYFIAETYYNNGDWIGPWTNNIQLWKPKKDGGKWRYLVYDLDFGLGLKNSVYDDRLSMARNPAAFSFSSEMFDALLNNPVYKRYFINRYADLINTIFTPSQMLPIMNQFKDSMAFDMVRHFAKWGSNMGVWQGNIDSMVSFINVRPNLQRGFIESQFGMNKQVTLTFYTNPPDAGRIQVSTVIPSSLPWTGVYFDGNPVTITAIPNPGYTFNNWTSNHGINNNNQEATFNFTFSTETIAANFIGSPQVPKLVVSEFNYNSDTITDASDWIEVHNYGTFTMDVSGWMLKDQFDYHTYTFPVGTVIPPNGYLVVTSSLNKFNSAYPTVTNVTGPLGFDLSNSGDQIRLFKPDGQLYQSFLYQDLSPWPVTADGGGYTCELSSALANLNDGNSWFPGCKGGSPGRAYSASLSINTNITGNSTFCSGSNTLLSVNYTPGYTYQWKRNNANIPTATDTFYTATQGGNYSVTVSYQGCSGSSDTLVVTSVTSSPAPSVTSNSRCGEGALQLSAMSTDSIYWFDSPTNGNLLFTGFSFTTPTITATTTYYAQTSLQCPSTRVPVTATINTEPADPIVNDQTICGPGSVALNATSATNVRWFNAASAGALLHTGNVFVTGYIPHDTVFYAEAFDDCVSERVALNVTIQSSPQPSAFDVSRCGSGQLVISAISSASVFWYDSIVGGNQVGSGLNFLTPSLSQSTYYYVESNNGCPSSRVRVLAQINPIPDPPVAADSSRCGTGSVNLYATANYQVFWYGSPSGGSSIASGSYFNTPSISQTTTYYTSNIDVCESPRVPVVAEVKALPAQPTGQDVVLCGTGSVQVSASSGALTIQWYDLPGGNLLFTGNTMTTPFINSTTVYYATAVSDCQSNPTPITVFVTPGPTVFLGNDTSITSGANLVLDAGTGYDSYNWSTGDTTQTITVNSTDTFSVYVTLNNCTGYDEISVTITNGIQENHSWGGKVNVFPNPTSGKLNIQTESNKNTSAVLLLTDVPGRVLLREEIRLTSGLNTREIDLTGYAKGVYFLTLRSNDNSVTMSVMVD